MMKTSWMEVHASWDVHTLVQNFPRMGLECALTPEVCSASNVNLFNRNAAKSAFTWNVIPLTQTPTPNAFESKPQISSQIGQFNFCSALKTCSHPLRDSWDNEHSAALSLCNLPSHSSLWFWSMPDQPRSKSLIEATTHTRGFSAL